MLFFSRKGAEHLKHKGTKAQRHKVFYKTKMLINGKCFQPFEHIEPVERIEPLKHHKPLKPPKPLLPYLPFFPNKTSPIKSLRIQ